MNGDDPRWRQLPVLRELFRQWRDARGSAPPGEFEKSFSRDWETLLEDAGLASAESRREADRDARLLAAAGLVILRTARYRSYQIERILVPVAAEPRLRALFADELPTTFEEKFDRTTVPWEPELCFLSMGSHSNIAAEDLLKLNEFFVRGGRERPMVPIKERSLQIFGDEKRLDALRVTSFFRSNLALDVLRCFVIAEPLGWQRGSNTSGPVLVIENAATWDTYCRWNRKCALFSAIVYGCGNRFAHSASRPADIFAEPRGSRAVLYFGDLDPQGLRIPQLASAYAVSEKLNLPPVEPHLWSYRQLLSLGEGKEAPWDGEPALRVDCDWLGEAAEAAWAVLSTGKRLAQEHVGLEFLQEHNTP